MTCVNVRLSHSSKQRDWWQKSAFICHILKTGQEGMRWPHQPTTEVMQLKCPRTLLCLGPLFSLDKVFSIRLSFLLRAGYSTSRSGFYYSDISSTTFTFFFFFFLVVSLSPSPASPPLSSTVLGFLSFFFFFSFFN